MNKIIEFFSGRKTFIVAGLMIVLGVLNSDNQLILEGLGLISLRLGISKNNIKISR